MASRSAVAAGSIAGIRTAADGDARELSRNRRIAGVRSQWIGRRIVIGAVGSLMTWRRRRREVHGFWIPGFMVNQAVTIMIILILALVELPKWTVIVRRERANLTRCGARRRLRSCRDSGTATGRDEGDGLSARQYRDSTDCPGASGVTSPGAHARSSRAASRLVLLR